MDIVPALHAPAAYHPSSPRHHSGPNIDNVLAAPPPHMVPDRGFLPPRAETAAARASSAAGPGGLSKGNTHLHRVETWFKLWQGGYFLKNTCFSKLSISHISFDHVPNFLIISARFYIPEKAKSAKHHDVATRFHDFSICLSPSNVLGMHSSRRSICESFLFQRLPLPMADLGLAF